MHPARIAADFELACAAEIEALKPGNVHLRAGGHGMSAADFLRSAQAAAPALSAPGSSLGSRVLCAVRATREAVGQNTNLGILLLCAPLAMAAELGEDLRNDVRRVIAEAGIDDTGKVFQAIVLAAPGGLGEAARNDVRGSATVPLLAAMAEAASRDRIARQYVSGFADVFGEGLAIYQAGLRRWADPQWAATALYLRFLAAAPDSHVLRKYGAAAAAEVRGEAIEQERKLLAARDPALCVPELMNWDAALKRRAINPGTCADLTVATIMAHQLIRGR